MLRVRNACAQYHVVGRKRSAGQRGRNSPSCPHSPLVMAMKLSRRSQGRSGCAKKAGNKMRVQCGRYMLASFAGMLIFMHEMMGRLKIKSGIRVGECPAARRREQHHIIKCEAPPATSRAEASVGRKKPRQLAAPNISQAHHRREAYLIGLARLRQYRMS